MNTEIDFEKVTEPICGFNVLIGENDPQFVPLSDLSNNEYYTIFYNNCWYYEQEIKEMLLEAYNDGEINLKW